MDDLISRQAALGIAFKYCPDDDGTCSEAGTDLRDMLDELENLPPAQPERIKGHWIAMEKKNLFRCSECGVVFYSESEYDRNEFHKFCGRCGADMREVTT